MMHRCSSPNCPGYPWKASEMPHPRSVCGEPIVQIDAAGAVRAAQWPTIVSQFEPPDYGKARDDFDEEDRP